MLYLRKSFTLPSAGSKVSDRQWDLATLNRAAFVAKYGADAPEYTESVAKE